MSSFEAPRESSKQNAFQRTNKKKKKKLPVELLYLWTSENCSPKDQNSQLSSGALLQ
jgi:hypothetical protein